MVALGTTRFERADRDRAKVAERRYYTNQYGLTRYELWIKYGVYETSCSGPGEIDVWSRDTCHDWSFPKPVEQAYIQPPLVMGVDWRIGNGNLLVNGDFDMVNAPLFGWFSSGSLSSGTTDSYQAEPNQNHYMEAHCDAACDGAGNSVYQDVKCHDNYVPGSGILFGGRVWAAAPVAMRLVFSQLDANLNVLNTVSLPFTAPPDYRAIPQGSVAVVQGARIFRFAFILGGNKLSIFVDDCFVAVF